MGFLNISRKLTPEQASGKPAPAPAGGRRILPQPGAAPGGAMKSRTSGFRDRARAANGDRAAKGTRLRGNIGRMLREKMG